VIYRPLIPSACGKRFCSVALTILWVGTVSVQTAFALDPTKNLSQYVRQVWTLQNGLPANDVHTITQTRDGYLWVGTEDGLARFDGARFQVFDKGSGQLPGNFIYCLFEDSNGSLWIGTSGGLVRYQAGKFQTMGREAGLADAFVYGVAQDRAGALWISANYKLWRYWENSLTCFDPLEQSGNLGGVVDVTVDKTDTVWAVLKGGIVCRFRDNHFDPVAEFTVLKGRTLARISTDAEGAVWISDFSGGVHRYQSRQVTTFGKSEGLPTAAMSHVIRDQNGNVWVGNDQGIARIVDGKCTEFALDSSVNAVYEDREGNLWVGFAGKGLGRFSDGSFTTFGTEDGLSVGSVKAVSEDSDHNLWLAASDGIYYRSRDRFLLAILADERLIGDLHRVELLTDPRDQSLWVGTTHGLFQYQRRTLTHYTIQDGLPSDGVTSLCLDRQMTLWVGCEAGLVCLKEGKFQLPEALQHVTHGKEIRNLVDDRSGGMWIGTGSGPMRYKNGEVTQFDRKDGLASIGCFQIYVGSDGIPWISTWNGGLAQYTGRGFFTYSQKDGLPSDQIYAIVDDPLQGDLWLGSERGVFRVNKKQLDDFRLGKTKRIFGTSFGLADGLDGHTICADGKPNVTRTDDGKFWWCLDQGAAVMDPNHLVLHNTPGPTVVESVTADDRPVTDQSPELLPGTRRLEIEYASLTYAAADKVQFRYRLDGVDRNWFDAGQRREAIFTSLRAGHYRFRVQTSADGGATWNEPGAELAFYVRPHFYETWWFFVVCGATTIALVSAVLTLRRRRLEAHFRDVFGERVRVAGEIHDSLAQGFTSAAMLLDSLDRLVPQDSPLRPRLKSIRYILGTSLTDTRAMIATLRGQPEANEDLEIGLRKLVERMAPISSASISLDFDDGKTTQVSAAAQQELIRICQEGINNSILHATAKHIWVTLKAENDQFLRLSVRDDGKGFDVQSVIASSENRHFGLIMLSERARRLGARLEIWSQCGSGTEIELLLPVIKRRTRAPIF
jgi:ligand-binding sensor domain-containing protein/signal transduction histidine kinase